MGVMHKGEDDLPCCLHWECNLKLSRGFFKLDFWGRLSLSCLAFGAPTDSTALVTRRSMVWGGLLLLYLFRRYEIDINCSFWYDMHMLACVYGSGSLQGVCF